jgi:hypothetical protein
MHHGFVPTYGIPHIGTDPVIKEKMGVGSRSLLELDEKNR